MLINIPFLCRVNLKQGNHGGRGYVTMFYMFNIFQLNLFDYFSQDRLIWYLASFYLTLKV
uniref:Uncharacterized protein n=1 Tax=Glycine max TaxID=3847 RepID=C6TEW6_SOYBN|nr:unknown [Glycine max]